MLIKQTITSIQFLRAMAALLVVFFHAQEALIKFGQHSSYLNSFYYLKELGGLGVDLFFIISGFIIFVIGEKKFRQKGAVKDFIIRRIIRIVPLYWFYTTIILILVIIPLTLKQNHFSWYYTLHSYFFIPTIRPSTGEFLPLLVQGWTLSFEMYFYLIFSVSLLFAKRFFLPILGFLLIPSVMASYLFVDLARSDPIIWMITNPLLLEFLFGSLLGLIYCSNYNMSQRFIFFLIITACLLFIAMILYGSHQFERLINWGIPCALITSGLIFYEKKYGFSPPNFILALGNSSYSLYLSHGLIIILFSVLLKRSYLNHINGDLLIIMVVGLSIFIGQLSYIFIEKNVTQFFLKIYQQKNSVKNAIM